MDRETVDEIKRHFGVVSEDVRSEVRAVAEGQALASQGFEGGLARLEDRMERGFASFSR